MKDETAITTCNRAGSADLNELKSQISFVTYEPLVLLSPPLATERSLSFQICSSQSGIHHRITIKVELS